MRAYLDASGIVPLFLPDVFAERIEAFLATDPDIVVSDFAMAEFTSVVGIRLRMKSITLDAARKALRADDWVRALVEATKTTSADIQDAVAMLRRLDLVLRAPDAIHLAIAQRLGAELATFDVRMADCARQLGIAVVAL